MPVLSSRTDRRRLLRPRQPIAIIAPHPDDEIFGCGLLIAEAVRRRQRVTVIFLTDGEASHPGSKCWPAARLAQLRCAESRRALARLGGTAVAIRRLGWRDGQVAHDAAPLRLRSLLNRAAARTVLVTSPRDFHPDHQAAARIACAATSMPVFTYEVWSRLGGRSRRTLHPASAQKRWAVKAFRSQIGPYISDDPAGFTFDATALRALTGSEEHYRSTSPSYRIWQR